MHIVQVLSWRHALGILFIAYNIRIVHNITMNTLTIANSEKRTISSVVAANIRAEVARAGLNQVQLAKMLNMTQPQVSRRWRGSLVWTLDELGQVAAALGVSVASLVTPPNGGGINNPPEPYSAGGEWLPRLDSNQQPSDYWHDLRSLLIVA